MNESENRPLPRTQRYNTDDSKAWVAHWKTCGQLWRTEPEIDTKRQEYLEQCLSTAQDSLDDTYPFEHIKLGRADIEWLLAKKQLQNCNGLDLRGADLRQVNLANLPLDRARLMGAHLEEAKLYDTHLNRAKLMGAHLEGAYLYGTHLKWANLYGAYLKRARFYKVHLEGACLSEANLEGTYLEDIYMAGANFYKAYLEEAFFFNAHLEGTTFREAYLERTNLNQAHLEEADLNQAHLERTNLHEAHLEEADLQGAHLEGAYLTAAHLEGANLYKAHLEKVILRNTHLEKANLLGAHFGGAYLYETHLEGANICEATFDSSTQLINIFLGTKELGLTSIADVQWNGTNLALIDWSVVKMLGDESEAHLQSKTDNRLRLYWYRRAVRANRQLAVALRAQGLNEEADHFAYRAQLLQRVVWRLQRRPLKSLLSWFLYLLAGYGYRPVRSVAWYLAIIFGFAIAYFSFGHLPLLEAFVFSLTSFHGRGFFPGNNISLSDPRVVLAAFEAVVGLLIEISFIATFTQRFFGK